jgi:hypothetical protein
MSRSTRVAKLGKDAARAILAKAENVFMKKKMVDITLQKQQLALEQQQAQVHARELAVREKEAEAVIHVGRQRDLETRRADAQSIAADAKARTAEALRRCLELESTLVRLEVAKLRITAGLGHATPPTDEEIERAKSAARNAERAWVRACDQAKHDHEAEVTGMTVGTGA